MCGAVTNKCSENSGKASHTAGKCGITLTSFKVEQPPGAQNLCIGCTGKQPATDAPGLFEAPNARVAIDSLYLAQLCERVGAAALHDIDS